MKAATLCFFTLITVVGLSDLAAAGGKRDGDRCHVHKSCQSKSCVRLNPEDKFGVCCTPQDCAAVGAQCGSTADGCGIPLECGDCDPGSNCVNNQCVQGTTTTTTSTTTSTTTTTTTTSTTVPPPPTTTTLAPTTTTTIGGTTTTTLSGTVRTCAGHCGLATAPEGDGPECFCDLAACVSTPEHPACPDFLFICDASPVFICD